ncbi:hypothetical protein WICPIJ_008406 [Wickerhamomyces pijperi]|uniref:UBX domain-containing protein n=1 Tax=Wickerhamomyces pijperi TaxID=599730 RepID=A0A9P8PZG4_WICPI|nr:hypothetical protein WICPIJ_008406 [Wickerhamomyces pijperi]
MTQLSPTEQEKLNEFQIITNFPEEEYEKVVKLFQNNYWNLEIALSKYFDGQLDQESSREERVQPPSPPQPSQEQFQADLNNFGFLNNLQDEGPFRMNQDLLNIHAAVPKLPLVKPISNKWKSAGLGQLDKDTTLVNGNSSRAIGSLRDHFGDFFESPIVFLLLLLPRTITLLLSYIGSLFSWLMPSLASEFENSVPVVPTLPKFHFAETFQRITHDGSTEMINHHKGEFNEAYMEAKTDFKFLLLILLGEEGNDSSDTFVKKVLNNARVCSLLNNNQDDYIAFVANVHEPQGHAIAKSLNVKTVPAAYLLGNVSNGPSMVASMSLIAKIPVRSVNSFIGRINLETVKYKPEFIVKRFEKAELDYSRQIKEAQDRAYEESLESDRIKELAKMEKIKEKEREEAKAAFQKENKLKFINRIKLKFQELDNFEWVKGQFITIRFQLPSTGQRITQKFPDHFTSLDIYGFIELQLSQQETESTDAVDVHKDYKHQYEFDLISVMPRFTVSQNEEGLIIKDIKELWPNASLMVEYKLEEED